MGYGADRWSISNSDSHSYLGFDINQKDASNEKYRLKVLVDTLTNCGRWMIVMSNLVPISLIVTVETVRFVQGIFMSWDIDLCDLDPQGNVTPDHLGVQAGVQASNLNESLGQVDYIFSDKTGTLTKNYMEFKKVSIGDYTYGLDCGLSGKEGDSDLERAEEQNLLEDDKLSSRSSVKDTRDHRLANFNFYDPEFEMHLRDPSHPNHRNIVNFLTHLALCHTIVI